MTTVDYWKKFYDSFGITHAHYEVRGYCVVCLGRADSIVNKGKIGLLEHSYHDSFAAKFTAIVSEKMIAMMKIYIVTGIALSVTVVCLTCCCEKG